jgi:hypothetical protein
MSRFLLHLFAAFAEMEREIICERVRAGMRAAKALANNCFKFEANGKRCQRARGGGHFV